eukprot:scaffold207667_cov29-Tisochrysis_lutea.AAC.5
MQSIGKLVPQSYASDPGVMGGVASQLMAIRGISSSWHRRGKYHISHTPSRSDLRKAVCLVMCSTARPPSREETTSNGEGSVDTCHGRSSWQAPENEHAKMADIPPTVNASGTAPDEPPPSEQAERA